MAMNKISAISSTRFNNTYCARFLRRVQCIFKLKIKQSLAQLLMCCSLGLGVSSCSTLQFPAVFKIDVAQGTILEAEKVKALRPGMTQRQVVYLLGNPLIQDPLRTNRWDYVYSFKTGDAVPKTYAIKLWFDGKILKKIDGDIDKIKDWHEINANPETIDV